MYRITFALKDMLLALVFLVPIFLVYAKFVFGSVKRTLPYFAFAAYLAAVYSLVGLPDILYLRFDPSCNFIPFVGMIDSPAEALLNVLLFVPLGFFLPVLCKRYRSFPRALLFGLCVTAGIELLQLFTFRTTDVDDLLTNVAGTVIGYFLAKAVTRGFRRLVVAETSAKYVYLTLLTAFFVMFLLVPLPQL